MGGTGSITRALAALMERQGVTIRTSTTVERIIVEEGEAKGVVLAGGERLTADIIVSNADPSHLYGRMIRPAESDLSARMKLAGARHSMGLFVLYFGTTRIYPDVAHHTIWLGPRYRELLKDIFHRKLLAEDFSLYLHRPTATDPSFAPAGCDSFYVLCPVPNLQSGINWEREGTRLRDRIVKALGETMLPGLSSVITAEFFRTPVDFQNDYLSVHGSGFSIAPIFRQSAWFRFHNKGEGIRNLYLSGAGTHPGAGLPGVLCSAKVVDSMIPALDPYAAP